MGDSSEVDNRSDNTQSIGNVTVGLRRLYRPQMVFYHYSPNLNRELRVKSRIYRRNLWRMPIENRGRSIKWQRHFR